jgi:hypothetical protein
MHTVTLDTTAERGGGVGQATKPLCMQRSEDGSGEDH